MPVLLALFEENCRRVIALHMLVLRPSPGKGGQELGESAPGHRESFLKSALTYEAHETCCTSDALHDRYACIWSGCMEHLLHSVLVEMLIDQS